MKVCPRERGGTVTQKHWAFDVTCSLRRCPVAAEGAGSSLVSLTVDHRDSAQEAAAEGRLGLMGSFSV